MFNGQMELNLARRTAVRLQPRNRPGRAQWWFQRMRQVVDDAVDYPPAPLPPEPSVVCLPAAAAADQERQICE